MHASCVACEGRAVLILGPSGAGKSSLALRMLSLGAVLVSDDRTRITARAGRLVASCPSPDISGLIEARGIGILHAPTLDSAEVALVVDLGQSEDQRLPPYRKVTLLGCDLSLVLGVPNDHLPAALMQYLRHGRQA